jgi:hypothetical protein
MGFGGVGVTLHKPIIRLLSDRPEFQEWSRRQLSGTIVCLE